MDRKRRNKTGFSIECCNPKDVYILDSIISYIMSLSEDVLIADGRTRPINRGPALSIRCFTDVKDKVINEYNLIKIPRKNRAYAYCSLTAAKELVK